MSSEAPGNAWPALTYESLPWSPASADMPGSRAQRGRHRGPYRAAVLPAIHAEDIVLPAQLAAKAEDAATQAARFDAEVGHEIAHFGAVLLRSESAASSQIENLTASARAIAEAELGVSGRRNAAEIVGNTRAMSAAIGLSDNLDETAILAMHRALLDETHPEIAGHWRAVQVWIGGIHHGPHEAMFVPPQPDRIAAAITDLIAFGQRNDLPVLPQAAVTHAQFETIHPFVDGNGRTGRALLHAMLRAKGLTRSVTVPISAGLLVDTSAYFAALDAYRAGDPTKIVDQVCEATFRALTNGRHLVADLRAVRGRWAESISARRSSTAWRVADLVLQQPVINAAVLTRRLNIRASNVYRSLEPLVQAGVLTELTDRKRDRAWYAADVLTALDAFAARAGRRSPIG